jgi:hypothetical protein
VPALQHRRIPIRAISKAPQGAGKALPAAGVVLGVLAAAELARMSGELQDAVSRFTV